MIRCVPWAIALLLLPALPGPDVSSLLEAQERTTVGPPPPMPAEQFIMDPPGIQVENFATGLEAVWDILFLPDGRTLISERPGRIRVVTPDGTLQPEPWAEPHNVYHDGGGGMMGLALHPDYPREPWVYAMYTAVVDAGWVNRVSRFRVGGAMGGPGAFLGGRALEEEVILDYLPAVNTHNGGRIAFGPDGMLYVTLGDTGQRAQAQNPYDLRGSILRVTPLGETPRDNPWAGTPVWAKGLRNVHGVAFHPATGALFAADHGPSGEWREPLVAHLDEVNIVEGGKSYGWPVAVGAPGLPGHEDPLLAWEVAVPPGGLAFYTGTLLPHLQGDLFLTGLRSEALHRIRFQDPDDPHRVTALERWFVEGELGDAPMGEGPSRFGRLRAVATGPDGALYIGTSNIDRGRGEPRASDDRVIRIVPVQGLRE
ncbi:MAG: PQQ-dependent sugar dehydrogenase [Gemmatimonadota bacterium]